MPTDPHAAHPDNWSSLGAHRVLRSAEATTDDTYPDGRPFTVDQLRRLPTVGCVDGADIKIADDDWRLSLYHGIYIRVHHRRGSRWYVEQSRPGYLAEGWRK